MEPKRTKVRLMGVLGKKFGKEWNVVADSVPAALRIIDANEPTFGAWMRANASKFDRYHVEVKKSNGRKLQVSPEELQMISDMDEITITPIIAGAGAKAKIVIGVVLMVAAFWCGPAAPYVFSTGMSLTLAGITQLITPNTKTTSNTPSYFFSGPVNTSEQGAPVPLIYGKCLVGSTVISAKITVDDITPGTTSTVSNSTSGQIS